MIASNFRKHPQAMALQFMLPFGRVLKWATSRPTTRVLRTIRAERARLIKRQPRIQQPTRRTTPQWFKDARDAAKSLARTVKAACLALFNGD